MSPIIISLGLLVALIVLFIWLSSMTTASGTLVTNPPSTPSSEPSGANNVSVASGAHPSALSGVNTSPKDTSTPLPGQLPPAPTSSPLPTQSTPRPAEPSYTPPPPVVAPAWVRYPDQDVRGNDVAYHNVSDETACQAKCGSDSRCLWYTSRGKDCWLHGVGSNSRFETIIKLPGGQYRRVDNTDIYGFDIAQAYGTSDTASCAAACAANPNCKWASRSKTDGVCYMKNSVPTVGYNFGFKGK